MNNENEMETAAVVNEQTDQEDQITEQEKKFTQEDVDRIVGERLKAERERKKSRFNQELEQERETKEAEFAERETAFAKRESRLNCKEYLVDNGYPTDLVDVIDTDNEEEFKNKVKKAISVLGIKRRSPYPDYTPTDHADMSGTEKAFRNPTHTPKQRY